MKRSLFALADEMLVMPRAPLVVMAASVTSLAIAFIAQYSFDEKPCILCLWQRIPFALAILITGMTFLFRKNHGVALRLLLLTGVLFFGESALAFFHSGVEQHWWMGTDGCAVKPISSATDSAAFIRQALLATEIARCDVISWTFLGYSMANWNVLFSFGLSTFAFMAAYVLKTGRKIFAPKKEAHVKPVIKGKG